MDEDGDGWGPDRKRLAERLHAAAAGSLSGMYILAPVRGDDGAITTFRCEYVNPMGARITGFDVADVVGRTMREIIPSRADNLFSACREVLQTGQPLVEEFEVPEFPEETRWLRHQIIPLGDGVAISTENITARRAAELALHDREAMLQGFLKNCPGLAWIGDEHGNTLESNAAYVELARSLGIQQLPASLWEMFPRERADLYQQNNRRIVDGGRPERVLEPGVRVDGSMGLFETFKFPLGERDGVRLVGGISIDITEREGEHMVSERLASIVRSSGDAIMSLDRGGNILSWNRGAQELFGYSADEAIGAPLSLLVPKDALAQAREMMARVLDGAPMVRYETVHHRRDGGLAQVQLSLSPIIDRDGLTLGVSQIATDIGEQHRREAQIRYFAEHDAATGALNERGLLLAASRRIEQNGGRPMAMMRLSVDRYSEFRDVFGVHHAGTLLRQVVERLAALPGPGLHEVALISHNEFAVLVDCEDDGLTCVHKHLTELQLLVSGSMEVLGIDVQLRARCGAALYPAHAASAEDLLRCADLALGQARRNGDRRPVVYDPAMGEFVAMQVRMQHELSRALERGQLRVVLQPICDDNEPPRTVGMEALVRWSHPELGEVPPQRFIPVAEESGLIVDIGTFVLDEACRIKAGLDAAGHADLFLSVNVSREQFRTGDLPARVAKAVAATGVDPHQLELEITESLLMEHAGDSERQLREIGRMGVGLTVDDFGTGYSNLAYLQRFPLTKLKVDRSFVSGFPGNRGALEIVRTILTLARALGLRTLAEGVERLDQRQALLVLGCEQYQGYLYSRPVEADAMRTLLDNCQPERRS